ncbi:site-specific integrase [Corallincola luteus]|uniref:Site-specific integrase n=1 Tax=Corallincola luteus TaxID=1775177 RepID=A0ABY2APB2_9GAMM|nr:site-specific integrase [Corallincola luteus]TCI05030.1 site-specific integrase [Corallincola luteus]
MAKDNLTKKPLTVADCHALNENTPNHTIADQRPHLGLRLKFYPKTKTKTWFYRYSLISGSKRQIKIGHFPDWSLSEARQAHAMLRKMRDSGVDPKEHRIALKEEKKREEEEQRVQSYTVEELVGDFFEEKIVKRRAAKGQYEFKRFFDKDVLPFIGKKAAKDLSTADVTGVLDRIVKRGCTRHAQVVLREFQSTYEYAIKRGRIPERRNPCAGLAEDYEHKTKAVRPLKAHEVPEVIDWMPRSGIAAGSWKALMIYLYTGCRGSEIVAAEWKDIDLKRGFFYLDKTKTEVPRVVQLSRQAVSLLTEMKAERTSDKWVFPKRYSKSLHITQKRVGDALREKQDSCPVQDWTPHSLRKTVRTQLASMGCSEAVAEAAIGHGKKGIVAVYNLHSYELECRDWLQKWADRMDELLAEYKGKS